MKNEQATPQIKVNDMRCNGCSRCVPMCPLEAITISDEGLAEINHTKCTLCQACLDACPRGALGIVVQ
ncbi:MAG: 4Fe-4S binding protein [Deltaproteobacteria bacterium]|nr:4Fe-4S binding protein [Deltaproteobacteria bacterium]MBN2674281.1 4Fe-4S binding protein [Deltaproteobacteria bacterium]